MTKIIGGVLTVLAVGLLLPACTPTSELSSAGTKTPPPKATGAAPIGTEDNKWEKLVTEAKKEGVVSIYTTMPVQSRIELTAAFKQKYDINLEFTFSSRGAELVARAQAEKTANLYNADVFGDGATTILAVAKPAGLLGFIEPLLQLPEVKDPKAWRGGVFPFLDESKQVIAFAGYANRFINYNTNMVREGEITSYRDLLKPQYKGKVTLNDPSMPGAGVGLLGHLAYQIWTEQEAIDYMKELLKNEIVVMRDQRLQVEWLAKGRNPIALATHAALFMEFVMAGAPISSIVTKEGVYITSGDSVIAIPQTSPHPNATALFINWLLTREGQTVYHKAVVHMSMRRDVSTEGLPWHLIPGPEEKAFFDTEDSVLKRGKLADVAKRIFETK